MHLGRHVGAGEQDGACAYRDTGTEHHAVADNLPPDDRPENTKARREMRWDEKG